MGRKTGFIKLISKIYVHIKPIANLTLVKLLVMDAVGYAPVKKTLGNCWLDYIEGVTRFKLKAVATAIQHDVYQNTVLNGINTCVRRYCVVGECPDNETNKLLYRYSSEDTFDDVMWVLDPVSDTIYDNKFCAAWHAVMGYKEWDLLITSAKFF